MGFMDELRKLTQPIDDEDDFFEGANVNIKPAPGPSTAQLEFENTFESVSVSAGLYVATEEDKDTPIERLVERADKQLYNAKKHGKNCVSYLGEIY